MVDPYIEILPSRPGTFVEVFYLFPNLLVSLVSGTYLWLFHSNCRCKRKFSV